VNEREILIWFAGIMFRQTSYRTKFDTLLFRTTQRSEDRIRFIEEKLGEVGITGKVYMTSQGFWAIDLHKPQIVRDKLLSVAEWLVPSAREVLQDWSPKERGDLVIWSCSEDEELLELKEEGLTYLEISKKLDRTREACRKRYYKLRDKQKEILEMLETVDEISGKVPRHRKYLS